MTTILIRPLKLLFLLILLYTNSIHAQSIKYFDVNGKEINEKTFHKKLDKEFVFGFNGSQGMYLVSRDEVGSIDTSFVNELSQLYLHRGLNDKEFLVFLYHPGADDYNSRGMSDKQWLQNWDNSLIKGLKKYNSLPIFVYKTNTGLEKYKGIRNYVEDNYGYLESTFFTRPYPGGSFVVIDQKGRYKAEFGEYDEPRS